MASPLRPWAGLHADLFLPIVERLRSPADYASVRAVCTAWRSALPSGPRSPSLLVFGYYKPNYGFPRYNAQGYALSLPMQRTFRLHTLPCHGSSVIASSNGYLTIANRYDRRALRLLNPITGEAIELIPLPKGCYPCRIVLGPNPSPDDYTVVAILEYGYNVIEVAYVTSRDTEWTIAHVIVDGARLVDLAYDAGCSNVYYCLYERGDIHVLHIPQGGRSQKHIVIDPFQIEPSFDVPAAFSPPYDVIAKKISCKRLFSCQGTLYQVWQNTRNTIKFRLREGGVFTMDRDEIVILRYYPEPWPCWDVVKELRGYSVFIGLNNTVVVQAEAALQVRPNCVYWIDRVQCTAWVFDMSTRTSTRCVLPPCVGTPKCWYFNND